MYKNTKQNWTYPTDIRLGFNRILEINEIIEESDIKHPLIVTDNLLKNKPMVKRLVDFFGEKSIFTDIQGNPSDINLYRGIDFFKKGNFDGVVAIGGGSAIDVGKLIALMAFQKISVWDLEDYADWWRRADISVIKPIIAIPTTAGTGSEVGRAAVLINSETKTKKILIHPKMMPSIVIADPNLTVGLPANLTAATGFDSLTHALETYCVNNFFHPMADGIACESIKLVFHNLENAFINGEDIDARFCMLCSSLMAGVAFQKGLGAVHSLAHSIGGIYDIHHGLLNAILLPYVLEYNKHFIEQKISNIAKILKIGTSFDDYMKWLLNFRKNLKIPNKLSDVGLSMQRIDIIAKNALLDPSTATNPRSISDQNEFAKIYEKALIGDIS